MQQSTRHARKQLKRFFTCVAGGPTFMAELEAMVRGRRNHPSIVQWDIFNGTWLGEQQDSDVEALGFKLKSVCSVRGLA